MWIKGENVIKYRKTQRVKWWRYLNRVKDIKVVKKMYDWKPTGKKKWTTKEMKGK
jgi:hypothetical protein